MRRRIDFNCDLGEGCGDDAAIAPWISSASIACGGHTGDAASMRRAVALCLEHGVAIGAHPAFEDRAHFGRRELTVTPEGTHLLMRRQVEALAESCARAGAVLHHVKPHGALYNLAARDDALAQAVADAVRSVDASLWLYALAGSRLVSAGRAAGLRVASEAFAERRYAANGQLAPRGEDGAVIEGLAPALAQVRTMLREGAVPAIDGSRVRIDADTLCLHGDRENAAGFARALRAALEAEGVSVGTPGGTPGS
ncbi:5-oxoprolinase subunit PxpA [Luteimonas dalianensis]|uniref:5-oxoprolinase subunit PxpA n=1 Tax=Luteimonas dalianensis TaxID=1148196 RepID=UPI003BF452B9